MNPRSKGKAEMMYYRACLEIERIFSDAAESGVDPDDLLFYAYGIVTRGTGLRPPATATKGSAFELRLKTSPQNGEPPVQDGLQADRTPFQENIGKNHDYSSGPAQAANNSPEENPLCPEACRITETAAVLQALFAAICPATEGCAAAKRLPGCVPQTGVPFCSRSDTHGPHPSAGRPESCREYLQTIQSSREDTNRQFPCFALKSILNQMRGKEQGNGNGGGARL